MSVECRIYVGLTLEVARDLKHEDFRRAEAITTRHPELDEYNYHYDDKEGKLLLIGDGMNGDFLRLIRVDKIIEGGSLGDSNEFIELLMPGKFNPDLITQMSDIYEEYTDTRPAKTDFKYAMWSQWY